MRLGWRTLAVSGTLVFALTTLAGCGTTPHPASKGNSKPPKSQQQAKYVGQMALKPMKGLSGSQVTVMASGLPANATFDLTWQTFSGHWNIKRTVDAADDYYGRGFTSTNKVLQKVRSDSNGSLTATFTVPQGFGADHTVSLIQNGVVRNQALFRVTPTASLATTEGPPGSPIEITMKGIGTESYHNNWMLLYDNKYTGWISSVTTDGTAHVTLPATGGPGPHVITIIHGAYQFPYINTQQSPYPKPVFALTYTITSGKAVTPPAPARQGLPSQQGVEPSGTGTAAWVSPASGPILEPLTVRARNLPAGQTVKVIWHTVEGNDVSPTGWSPMPVSLGKATVGSDGALTFQTEAPDGLGGVHTISIVDSSGKTVAETKYNLTPSAISISPMRGPVGTTITIHLKGVGWRKTNNIYTLDYDNAYYGYACGFNSQGDVVMHIEAVGQPGWHYIDLYPAIYEGHEITGTNDFRLPELTPSDHPGGTLPAFHFAFYVTGN